MKPIFTIASVLLVMVPVLRQDRLVTAAVDGKRLTVKWKAPVDRPGGDWIGIYRVGMPVEPFPASTLWRYVPEGESGELEFEIPESGEWEARYLTSANAVLASAKVLAADLAPVTRSRLRKLSYYENGILLWETETMDDTEASRHLTNVSLSDRRGIEARIEVRHATVTYPAQPDEVGTWRK